MMTALTLIGVPLLCMVGAAIFTHQLLSRLFAHMAVVETNPIDRPDHWHECPQCGCLWSGVEVHHKGCIAHTVREIRSQLHR